MGYSLLLGHYCNKVQPIHRFLDALRSRSLGDSCGEVASNVFFLLCNGPVGGVALGAAYLDETDLVLFCSGMSVVATPPEVLHFLLLGPLGLVRVGLLGVCCEGVRAGSLAAYPSAVIAAMISSRCFVSVGVRVTLAAAASSSASMSSASSSDAGGVITFSLPFRERTGMGGSFAGSSSSSRMMCVFLVLEEVLAGGSSSSFLGSFSSSVEELSVIDLTPSSSD